jgi:hypothetical protein
MDTTEVGLATTQRAVRGNDRSRGLTVHLRFDDQTPRGGLEVAGGDRCRE